MTHPINTVTKVWHAIKRPLGTAHKLTGSFLKPVLGSAKEAGSSLGKSLIATFTPKSWPLKRFSVIGTPIRPEQLKSMPRAYHLTSLDKVDSIMREGLRPTEGLYKNLTVGGRSSVYMFGRKPGRFQKIINFAGDSSRTKATIEVDLTALDPSNLYYRGLDEAIIYRTKDPIPPGALKVIPTE